MAMTLRLTEAQNEELRRQAEREKRSMQAIARDAIDEYIERRSHRARVEASSRRGAERYAEALDVLGNS
jgi:predicted transcriptional regulator